MKKMILLASLLVSSLSFAQAINYSHDLVMVKMKPGSVLASVPSAQTIRHLFADVYVVKTNNLYRLEAELKSHPNVVLVERDYHAPKRELAKVVATPKSMNLDNTVFNDPYVSKIWSFNNASLYGVSVLSAYTNATSAAKETILVAVVDTGIDYNHEDLKNIVWTNEDEIAGNGVDDDNNGYIDDIHGINTLVRDSAGRPTPEIMDGHSHGTHVSGTIGAEQNNNTGIAGIASKVKIMGIRTVPNSGDETDVNVVESYIYAAKNGAKLINCSFGKAVNEGGQIVKEAMDYIGKEYGVLVIIAAGNDSSNIDSRPTWPASYTSENTLVIASTGSNGALSYFSNYGATSVDVAAPGSNIYSSTPGNTYQSMSGTSMATPTTVGVAAEVWSHYPHLTHMQLKKVLMDSVTKMSGFAGRMQAAGRIDLEKALALAATIE